MQKLLRSSEIASDIGDKNESFGGVETVFAAHCSNGVVSSSAASQPQSNDNEQELASLEKALMSTIISAERVDGVDSQMESIISDLFKALHKECTP